MTKECRVWTIKDNYRLGEDIQSKVLAFAFGLSAEIERNLISQRTKEALARKRQKEQCSVIAVDFAVDLIPNVSTNMIIS